MAVACIAALVFELVERTGSTVTKARHQPRYLRLGSAGPLLRFLEKEIFENEPPLLRSNGFTATPTRYLAIEC